MYEDETWGNFLKDLIGIPLIAFWPVIPLAALAGLAWWVWL